VVSARTIINSAGRKIGVVSTGETMPAYEAQNALSALNSLLGTLSVEGGMVYTTVIEAFTLTSAASYTIGSGGDFNTARPIEIEAIFIREDGGDYPLAQVSAESYANVFTKTLSGIPEYFYYTNNNPLATIYLYPTPQSGTQLHMYSRKALTAFADLDTNYNLPDGMQRMLEFNLAVDLAVDYEKEVSRTVKVEAMKSKKAVLVYNSRHDYPTIGVDDALLDNGVFNIYSGSYR